MEPLVIAQIERVLRAECASLDPGSVPLPEAPEMYLAFDRIAKLAEGAKTRLLARVDAARPAGPEGKRSTADWDAEKTGTTPGAAKQKLDTSKRLHDQPGVDEALAKGELSGEQANAVSGAAGADPAAEEKLLDDARTKSVKDLRRECDRVKANACPDPAARRRAIHRDRHVRTWVDAEGGWNLKMRHLPEVGAEIEAEIARYAHAAFERARQEGRREGSDAYRADAFVDLVRAHAAARRAAAAGATTPTTPMGIGADATAPSGPTTPAGPPAPVDLADVAARLDERIKGNQATTAPSVAPITAPKGARIYETKTFVHIDYETLLRGHVEPGSICHIDGVGDVDVAWVRQRLGDSFVVLLLKDGDRIVDLVHAGRDATALQRSYKEAQGIHCERPGCSCTDGLELHHVEAWSPTRQTTVLLLAWLCAHDHDLVTHHRHQLARGPNGEWIWTTPTGTTRAGPAPPKRREREGSDAAPQPGPRSQQLFADPGVA